MLTFKMPGVIFIGVVVAASGCARRKQTTDVKRPIAFLAEKASAREANSLALATNGPTDIPAKTISLPGWPLPLKRPNYCWTGGTGRPGSGDYQFPYSHCHDAANDFCDVNPALADCGVVVCNTLGGLTPPPHAIHTINWVIVDGKVFIVEPQNPFDIPTYAGSVSELGNPPTLLSPPVDQQLVQRMCVGQGMNPVALPPGKKVPESPPEVCSTARGIVSSNEACTSCCDEIANQFPPGPKQLPGFNQGVIEGWRVECLAACNGVNWSNPPVLVPTPTPASTTNCSPGWIAWNSQCYLCPEGYLFDRGNCIQCPAGFSYRNGLCLNDLQPLPLEDAGGP